MAAQGLKRMAIKKKVNKGGAPIGNTYAKKHQSPKAALFSGDESEVQAIKNVGGGSFSGGVRDLLKSAAPERKQQKSATLFESATVGMFEQYDGAAVFNSDELFTVHIVKRGTVKLKSGRRTLTLILN
jgi:hypothetical protein